MDAAGCCESLHRVGGASGSAPPGDAEGRPTAAQPPVRGTRRAEDIAAVLERPDTRWAVADAADLALAPTRGVEAVAEAGDVLAFPCLPFELDDGERRFLEPRWARRRARDISVHWPSGELRGAAGRGADLAALRSMIVRYAECSEALARRLFPHYQEHLRRGSTSLRPPRPGGRVTDWRRDDARLHIDAVASEPSQGMRLLRVFTNVDPSGEPRRWRLGERFEAHARRYLASMHRPLPASAWLLERLRITRQRRTEYDHYMLRLHDIAMADTAFQRGSPQASVEFAAGTTWVAFGDQVLHAATSSHHVLEQTFLLPPEALRDPQTSPLAVLEKLTGRRLRDERARRGVAPP